MRKLLFLLVALSSCSKPEDNVETKPATYNVQLTATCPSASRNTYCVSKEIYDYVRTTMRETPNQGCVYVEINTVSDGIRKGYILSAGAGCY